MFIKYVHYLFIDMNSTQKSIIFLTLNPLIYKKILVAIPTQ